MGNKKQKSVRPQNSFQQLVSNVAMDKMIPQVEEMVQAYTERLGEQLALQQASTLEMLYTRLVVLEAIVIDKLGYTAQDLTDKVADLEDLKEGYERSDSVNLGDMVRVEISTKTKDQEDFQGSSRLKISNVGSGQSYGEELESSIVGMASGETKEVFFGEDQQLVAKITLNRVSKKIKGE